MLLIFKYLVNIISKTWRIVINGELPNHNAIIGFWHGRMLPGWNIFRNTNSVAVVSSSKDGEILSSILELWGLELIRGSSSKGGKEVLDSIVGIPNEKLILMTPDGPRGPRHEMKAGMFVGAQRSNREIFFLKIEISNYKLFEKAWDKFMFPLPFSNININVIGPINVNSELNKDEISDLIKKYEKEFYQE